MHSETNKYHLYLFYKFITGLQCVLKCILLFFQLPFNFLLYILYILYIISLQLSLKTTIYIFIKCDKRETLSLKRIYCKLKFY
jgi:hypothetical protein